MINPEFVERDGVQLEEEGCLSVPGFNATVVRPSRAVVKGLDRNGDEQQVEGIGAAGARVSARDGSSRRHAVRRSPARHQARPDRPQDQEAHARGQMVTRPSASSSSARPPSRCRRSRRCSRRAAHASSASSPSRIGRAAAARSVSDAPVKARALDAALPVLQPDRMKDPAFLDRARRLERRPRRRRSLRKDPDRRRARDAAARDDQRPRVAAAEYRGAAPVHRAVIDGEPITGVTIMRVVKALDAGPMLAHETTADRRPTKPVTRSSTTWHASARTCWSADRPDLPRAGRSETPQDDAAATYAHRMTRDDGAVDWRWPAARIHNLIRGLHPWPHAFTYIARQATDPDRARRLDRRRATARPVDVERRERSSRPAAIA